MCFFHHQQYKKVRFHFFYRQKLNLVDHNPIEIQNYHLIHNPSEIKISQATNHPLNNDKKKKNWMSSSFFRNFALF